MSLESQKSSVNMSAHTDFSNIDFTEKTNLGVATLDNAVDIKAIDAAHDKDNSKESKSVDEQGKVEEDNTDKKEAKETEGTPEKKGEDSALDHAHQEPTDKQDNHQNVLDINEINAAARPEAQLQLIEGHDSILNWDPYGLPIGEQSIPRDFNIEWSFLAVVPLYEPLVRPPVEIIPNVIHENHCTFHHCCERPSGNNGGQVTPIVLDLNHNGFELSAAMDSHVILNKDGTSVQIGWVGADDGLLTYNYSGQGPIENKNWILTDDVPGAKTDLQALEILVGQNNGIIDQSNPIWDKLGVWQDTNQNGKMDPGEYHTLSQLNIVSISLDAQAVSQVVNGNTINAVLSFNYQDGTTGKAADVALKYEDVVQTNQNILDVNSTTPSSQNEPAAAVAPVQPVTAEVQAPIAPPHIDSTVQSAIDTTHHHHVAVAA